MANRSMAQGIIMCDICEASPVQMYCNSCATNLCKGCIGEHISADTETDHNIVTYKRKNVKPIYPDCKTHKDKCEMKCKQCDVPVCMNCLISGSHKKHDLLSLLELFNSQKNTIKWKTKELETSIYPKYEQAISDFELHLQNLPQTYDSLMSEISSQGEEMHREVDAIIKQCKQEVEKMKSEDLATLTKLLEEMKNLLSSLHQAIVDNNELLQSPNVMKILENKPASPEMWNPPKNIDVTPPTFTPLPIQGEQLHQMFGTLTAASIPCQISPTQLVEDKIATAVKHLQLLDSPESPLSIHTGCKYQKSITCLISDEVWVCGDKINRFTIHGSLQETVTTTTGNTPSGITVSSNRDLFYIDSNDRSINQVRHGKIEKIISLQQDWEPITMCSTVSDDLLITMVKRNRESRVVRYSGSNEKQVIQFDDQGKPFFSTGFDKFIVVNNDTICVSDYSARAILAFNQAGKLCFRYTGNLSSQKYKSFNPLGVVIDSMGHIIVADHLNGCIHIINQHGNFVRYIDNCDLCMPWDLSLDRNNNLYIAEYNTGKVKVIKYLS